MKKKWWKILCIMLLALMMVACGADDEDDNRSSKKKDSESKKSKKVTELEAPSGLSGVQWKVLRIMRWTTAEVIMFPPQDCCFSG